jgi:hypothetical protein
MEPLTRKLSRRTNVARFLLQAPHTEEECTQALDSIMGHSDSLLGRFDWGCKAGEHTGWVIVEAQDERTALMLLPSTIRDEARAVQLNKFTAAEASPSTSSKASLLAPATADP